MGALACSTHTKAQIASSILPDDRSVHQHRHLVSTSKGIHHHQGIVQTKITHGLIAIQTYIGKGEISLRFQQTASPSTYVAHQNLIGAIFHDIDSMIVSTTVKLPNFFTLLHRTPIVIHIQFKKQWLTYSRCLVQQKRLTRWQQCFRVLVITKIHSIIVTSHSIIYSVHLLSLLSSDHSIHTSFAHEVLRYASLNAQKLEVYFSKGMNIDVPQQ